MMALRLKLRKAKDTDIQAPAIITPNLHSEIPVEIGRSLLPAPTISKSHAFFSGHQDSPSITDNGSANGVAVNGIRITPHTAVHLRLNDSVVFAVPPVKLEPTFGGRQKMRPVSIGEACRVPKHSTPYCFVYDVVSLEENSLSLKRNLDETNSQSEQIRDKKNEPSVDEELTKRHKLNETRRQAVVASREDTQEAVDVFPDRKPVNPVDDGSETDASRGSETALETPANADKMVASFRVTHSPESASHLPESDLNDKIIMLSSAIPESASKNELAPKNSQPVPWFNAIMASMAFTPGDLVTNKANGQSDAKESESVMMPAEQTLMDIIVKKGDSENESASESPDSPVLIAKIEPQIPKFFDEDIGKFSGADKLGKGKDVRLEGVPLRGSETAVTPLQHAEPSATKISQQIFEQLTCSICFECMVAPHVLMCTHAFCGMCIDDWLNTGKKSCPQCRAKTTQNQPPQPAPLYSGIIDTLGDFFTPEETQARAERLAAWEARKEKYKTESDTVGKPPIRAGPMDRFVVRNSIGRDNVGPDLQQAQPDDYDEEDDDGDLESDNRTYYVEFARSGRSTCRTCRNLIPINSRRIAEVGDTEGYHYNYTRYHHYDCLILRLPEHVQLMLQ